MKVAFVIAKEDSPHSPLHQLSQAKLFPPVALAPMVKSLGKNIEVQVVDERRENVQHARTADIAVIFINSYNQQRALSLVQTYQQRGSFVVLTGPVLSLVPWYPVWALAFLAVSIFIIWALTVHGRDIAEPY